ncbi:MAG: hypothetical protein JXA78_16300 [Anaerolineales bacterium]|nr:hypothetical protein [Anaerolineales bacterium]
MRIEVYFEQTQNLVQASPFVHLLSVNYEKRGTYEGFLKGELTLADGSMFYFREYVDVEIGVERLMYVYQYMDVNRRLVFCYDNAGHHRRLELPTYPHHKHVDGEGQMIASSAPNLAEVLEEVQSLVKLA